MIKQILFCLVYFPLFILGLPIAIIGRVCHLINEKFIMPLLVKFNPYAKKVLPRKDARKL